MNSFWIFRISFVILASVLLAAGARAQLVDTRIENGEVVYTEGNALVVKFPSGELRQFEVPENSRFSVDGVEMTVHDLKPGMKLTTVISTAVRPRLVDSVKFIDMGTVWKIIGSNLIIRTPDGENRMYRVPSGGSVTIGGVEKSLDKLRPGDLLTATVVVTRGYPEPGSAVTSLSHAQSPPRVGGLLIDEGVKPIESDGENPADVEASSYWKSPIVLLLILVLLIVAVLAIRTLRRKRKAVITH